MAYGQEDFADGVKVFDDAGKLAALPWGAVTGPQVLPARFALAGRAPGQAHQFLDRVCPACLWSLVR